MDKQTYQIGDKVQFRVNLLTGAQDVWTWWNGEIMAIPTMLKCHVKCTEGGYSGVVYERWLDDIRPSAAERESAPADS